jgi:hypothetical protein
LDIVTGLNVGETLAFRLMKSIHQGLGVLQDDDKPLPVERDPDIGSCFCGSFPGLLYRTHKSSTGVARGIENVATASMN